METKTESPATGQVWRMYGASVADTVDYSGPELCDRAVSSGWADEEFFRASEVGWVLKTGVSAYERIA